jgi:hypothetical protein
LASWTKHVLRWKYDGSADYTLRDPIALIQE